MGLNVHYAREALWNPLGHHAITCKRGRAGHNKLRNILVHNAHLSALVEAVQSSAQTSPNQDRQIFSYRTGIEESHILCCLTAKLKYFVCKREQQQLGAALEAAELRKHTANDCKVYWSSWGGFPSLLWWSLTGHARQCFSRLALVLLSIILYVQVHSNLWTIARLTILSRSVAELKYNAIRSIIKCNCIQTMYTLLSL